MTAVLRISLSIVLSGLLFSPAEGVCLLPLPADMPDTEYEANTGTVRYLESIFRIEKPGNGVVTTQRSEKQSTPFVVSDSFCDSGSSVSRLVCCVCVDGPFDFKKLTSVHNALTIRPPPPGPGTNAF